MIPVRSPRAKVIRAAAASDNQIGERYSSVNSRSGARSRKAATCWTKVVWRAVQGAVTLGDLAMFHQAFQQGQRMMRTLLENVGQIYQNSLFLETLFGFLAQESELAEAPNPSPPPAVLHCALPCSPRSLCARPLL